MLSIGLWCGQWNHTEAEFHPRLPSCRWTALVNPVEVDSFNNQVFCRHVLHPLRCGTSAFSHHWKQIKICTSPLLNTAMFQDGILYFCHFLFSSKQLDAEGSEVSVFRISAPVVLRVGMVVFGFGFTFCGSNWGQNGNYECQYSDKSSCGSL